MTKRNLKSGLLFATIVLSVALTGASNVGAITETERQITNNLNHQRFPSIYGDKIVWSDYTEGDIYLYNISTGEQRRLTTSGGTKNYPYMRGDIITWFDGAGGFYLYDLKNGEERSFASESIHPDPWKVGIYDNKIVFSATPPEGGNPDIFLYDITTSTTTRITSDPMSERAPAIYGSKIVFLNDTHFGNFVDAENVGVYVYDLETQQLTKIFSGQVHSGFRPDIYEQTIVWAEPGGFMRPDRLNIYNLETGTYTNLDAQSKVDDGLLHIFQNKIVWLGVDLITFKRAIYRYDITTGEQSRISSDTADFNFASGDGPDIHEGGVVWADGRRGNMDVYLYQSASQNTPPVLSFPETEPYAGDGIDPNSGDTTTEFTFRVIYTDADNNPPSFIDTFLFGHATTTVPMSVDTTAESALHDGNYANGEQYAATARREVAGTNYYTFRASDGTTEVVFPQMPNVAGFPLEITSAQTNSLPTLSFSETSPDGLSENDGIQDKKGIADLTSFMFRVVYTDMDNDPPVETKLILEKFENGTFTPYREYDLFAENPQDFTYTDGKEYFVGIFLPQGKFLYYFRAGQNEGPVVIFPSAGDVKFVEAVFIEPPSPKTVIGEIDPNKPTIVITHGLGDDNYDEVSADGSFDELFSGFSSVRGQEGAGYLIKQQLGNRVNVIQFVWPEAFQGATGYVKARLYADDAGDALAKYLIEKLGTNYNRKIHFVGHSLGTVVNAHAARLFLDTAKNVSQAQVTILDYPNSAPISAIPNTYFATLLQELQQERDLKIDNYYSDSLFAFGNVALGKIYNHPNLNSPNDVGDEIFIQEDKGLMIDHTGVHQWYRWTMNPNGFNGTTFCEPDGTFNDPSIFFSGSLNPCERGWYWSLFGQGGWEKFPISEVGTPIVINAGQQLPLGDPHEFGCTYSAGVVICREQSSPYIVFDVAIPEGAEFISFDYRLPNIGDGDYVSVLLDDEPLWILAGLSAFNPSEFTNSGPIPLPQNLAEGTHKFTIALFGVGEKNAEFVLKNIQTIKTEKHTARSLKELVVQNLTDVKTEEKKTDKKIDVVIKHILESLKADLWKNDSHLNFPKGTKVFAKEVEAVAFMDNILRQDEKKEGKDKDIIPGSIKHAFGLAISDLLSTDRMLAETSLQEAKAKVVDDQKRREKMEKMVKKAEDAMRGAEEIINKKPAKAVIRYGKAWFFSQAAIKIAEKNFEEFEIPEIFSEDR